MDMKTFMKLTTQDKYTALDEMTTDNVIAIVESFVECPKDITHLRLLENAIPHLEVSTFLMENGAEKTATGLIKKAFKDAAYSAAHYTLDRIGKDIGVDLTKLLPSDRLKKTLDTMADDKILKFIDNQDAIRAIMADGKITKTAANDIHKVPDRSTVIFADNSKFSIGTTKKDNGKTITVSIKGKDVDLARESLVVLS